MGARGLVRLGTTDQSGHLIPVGIPYRRRRGAVSRQDHQPTKLPPRTRVLIIIGLAILAWLPIIAVGYAITVWV
jgi:hypothetical protein